MSQRLIVLLIVLIVLIAFPALLRGDAIVVSRAMFASTIAEYFVEEDRVRVELEIGAGDLPIFRNLMPDALYQDLGYGDEPLAVRVERFFAQDMAILVDGVPLAGGVIAMGPETRVRRDPVTGDPIVDDEEEPEVVIRATLVYPFNGQPESLALTAPPASGIGFVLYHQGVAVNDFRFLASGYEVRLDWEDPWYSTFNTRALRRQYFAPMTGFLYVEPYEVRKEIIVRPRDMQRYVDLGLDGRDTIPVAIQAEIRQKVIERALADGPSFALVSDERRIGDLHVVEGQGCEPSRLVHSGRPRAFQARRVRRQQEQAHALRARAHFGTRGDE